MDEIDAQSDPFPRNDPALLAILVAGILKQLKDSGATLEEAIAALRASEALIPTLQLVSGSYCYFHLS